MAERIHEIYTRGDAVASTYRFPEAAENLRLMLSELGDTEQTRRLRLVYATVLLNSGEPEEALRQYQLMESHTREKGPLSPAAYAMFETSKALCQLRLGEQENCFAGRDVAACMLPIQGNGVHRLPRGSRASVDTLNALLDRFPGDLRARWLLNIAYMTLGEYPASVPPSRLIPPEVFASDYDIKKFDDIAPTLGLDVRDLAGGVIMDDFDNDGLLDLMVSAWHPFSQLRLFRNAGDGTFVERTREAGIIGETGSLNMIQSDYNNDGFVDVLMLRGGWMEKNGHYPNSLLRNNGDGTFSDVTEEAGLLSFHPTQTAAWFDYNADGWLDLFIGNESAPSDPHPCELYRNNGDGTFTECAATNGLAMIGYVKGVVTGDFNNDGRPDLYLSRRDGANHLLRNDGPASTDRTAWRFTDVAKEAGVLEPFRSFSCWFWDYDNDGWEDIAVAGYIIQDAGDIAADYLGIPHGGERFRLYRNRGDGTFADVTQEVGLFKLLHTMGCNFGDLDNDGWLDFYVGTGDPDFSTLAPNRMFRSDGGKRFQDVTSSGGFGQLQKGHGIAFGDLDNDGDQDIYSVVGGAVNADIYYNQLFLNPGHGGRWLKLKLEGVRSNRDARGARIKVIVKTPSGERVLHRTVGSGGSFGASALQQEIGLGDADDISRVEIFWPTTSRTQTLTGISLDQTYRVREDQDVAVAETRPPFRFIAPPAGSESFAVAHNRQKMP
jgi:hypothetical protein